MVLVYTRINNNFSENMAKYLKNHTFHITTNIKSMKTSYSCSSRAMNYQWNMIKNDKDLTERVNKTVYKLICNDCLNVVYYW